jgi:hypothetical protein
MFAETPAFVRTFRGNPGWGDLVSTWLHFLLERELISLQEVQLEVKKARITAAIVKCDEPVNLQHLIGNLDNFMSILARWIISWSTGVDYSSSAIDGVKHKADNSLGERLTEWVAEHVETFSDATFYK